MRLLRRPLTAALLLLALYGLLSLANDPRGFLGTDTGAKVATLEVMTDRHRVDPDVGYWAERWDTDGSLHPLYLTSRRGDRWVQVTTLPMLYAAYPLYRAGGYRLALLLPMLGAVAAALAARALARRWGDDGTAAFWIVGLASPMTIYALDFWEHSMGVALMAWAAVLLLRVLDGPWWYGLAAGALLGTAAALRTEALVYAAVLTAAVVLTLLVARRPVQAVAAGMAVAVGLATLVAANAALESAAVGSALRVDRAAGAVGLRSSEPADSRVDEAVVTLASPMAAVDGRAKIAGLLLLALLLLLAFAAASARAPGPAARAAGAAVAALYLARLLDGPDFVPGLVAAAPLAAAGVVHAWGRRSGVVVAGAAVAALSLVWAFQFRGGAAPQWGGRYILVSGFLLTVAGVVALGRLVRWARVELVGLSVAVTVLGLVWLGVRSHGVGEAAGQLTARPEPVLVSRVAHLVRELGTTYDDRRWLTALSRADLREAGEVLEAADLDRFATVDLPGRAAPTIPGWRAGPAIRVRFLPDVDLVVTPYNVD